MRDRRRGVADAGLPFGPAYGQWMMANVRREIAAGSVRTTVDDGGVEHAIN